MTSAWRFDFRTFLSKLSRLGGCGGEGSTTRRPSESRSSTAESSRKPTSSAKLLGILTARLFPHRCTRVFTTTPCRSIYNDYTTNGGAWEAREYLLQPPRPRRSPQTRACASPAWPSPPAPRTTQGGGIADLWLGPCDLYLGALAQLSSGDPSSHELRKGWRSPNTLPPCTGTLSAGCRGLAREGPCG